MTTDTSSPNDPNDAFSREAEHRLAVLKQTRPNVGAFYKQVEAAVSEGNLPQLQALAIHAHEDTVLSGQAAEIFNKPIQQKSTLFLKAIHASRDGVPLPIELRSELLHVLMQAGAVPLKSPKRENPLALLVEQGFPKDLIRMANDVLVAHLGWEEGSILPELIPVLQQWTRRTVQTVIHEDPKAGLRRG